MNDLKDLFERALADGHGPARGAQGDPAGDLARGKHLLRRRFRARLGGAAAAGVVMAAAAAVAVPAAFSGGPAHGLAAGGSAAPVASKPATGKSPASPSTIPQVKLVAYTGAQPHGYEVKEIPSGWVIQGSSPLALTIAPANDPDKYADSFVGKLVVMQGEFDTSDAASTGWVATTVDGRTAYFNHGQPMGDGTVTAALNIEEAPGRWLTIQAPGSLGWTEAQFKEFGRGVTILDAARPTKG